MEFGNFIKIGDRHHKSYEGLVMKADSKLHESICSSIISNCPKGSRILDFGAGEGALSQRLSNLGFQILAVDINSHDFKAENVKFEQCDFNSEDAVQAFKIRNLESFDAVLGIEVIEHLENPWNYIRTLSAMVKPGGFIFISTPNTTSWYARSVFFLTGNFPSFINPDECGHINPISEWEIKVISSKLKLNLKKTIPAGSLPYIWISSSIVKTLINFVFLPFFPIMRGSITGWCKIFVIERPMH